MTNKRTETPKASGEPAAPPPKQRGRAIRLKTMNDVRVELAHVYTDMKHDRVALDKGKGLIYALTQVGHVIDGSNQEKRLEELEKRLEGRS